MLGTVSVVVPATVAGAAPAPAQVAASGTQPARPAPIEASAAFAASRGPGYEQRMNAARAQAARLPVAIPAGAGLSASWTPLGPAPGVSSTSPLYVNYGGTNSGRVTGLAVNKAGTTLYAAAAGGGVWSTTNGTSWTTNTDSQPDIAMGSVAVDPFDQSVVFGGTGEDNNCGDCYFGDGVLESTDGGSTWTNSNPGGVFTGADVSSIAFITSTASTLATTEVLAGTSNGLFGSTDGGTTWAAVSGGGWVTGNVSSLAVNDLTNPPVIYAGVSGVGVEISTDNGSTWTTEGGNAGLTATATTTIPASYIASVALAVVPNATAANGTVYASVAESGDYVGLFKSTDGGGTWTRETNAPAITSYAYGYGMAPGSGGQGDYDNVVAVDPTNPSIVVLGGITAAISPDGGTSWESLNANGYALDTSTHPNAFHPDVHALVFDQSGDLYMGNDGGVWELPATYVNAGVSPTSTSDFNNLNGNLDITQFYQGMSPVSGTASGTQILAGAQDNGTLLYSSTNATPTQWPIVDTGDGGFALVDPANPQIQYAEADIGLTGGGLEMTINGWSAFTEAAPTGYAPGEFASPLLFEPKTATQPAQVLFGASALYQSPAGLSTQSNWTTLATATTGSNVAALAVAPSNSAVLYAGFENGDIDMSSDGGKTWSLVDPPSGDFASAPVVTHLSVSPTDPYTLYATYSTADPATADSAQATVLVGTGLATTPSWTDVTGNLPASVPTNSVIPDGAGGLIVADDLGVYWAKAPNGHSTSWARLGTGLPNVQFTDVALAGGTLYAETHGRGIWSLPFSDKLTVTTPTGVYAGTGFGVTATVENALGTPITNDSGRSINLAVASGPAGATVSCTPNPVADSAGVASFSCQIPLAGNGYTLTASSAGLTSATTSAFAVMAVGVGGGGSTPSSGTPSSSSTGSTPTSPPPGPISTITRLYGQDAIATSIAVSQQAFPQPGSAGAVVLASDTSFADELSSGPLAAHLDAPLLLTGAAASSSSLDARVLTEIKRVLPAGKTVYVVGGDLALPASIDTTLTQAGFVVVREAGTTAAATAVVVAEALGNPSTVFEVTEKAPWDGLAAAPAAIAAKGAILLTDGPTQTPETAAYLKAHPGDTRYAIGGPYAAAGADPTATAVYGKTAEATTAAVATRFFPGAGLFGAATTLDFQDGLVGGLYMETGGRSGPLLLVDPKATPALDPAVTTYLESLAPGTPGVVFGGPLALPLLDVTQLKLHAGNPTL